MRIAATGLLICLILPAVSAPVHADPSDDCALARKANKTCVLDIAAEDVDGKVPTADELAVHLLSFGKAGSLIRVRRDFIPEIIRAAEALD